LGGLLRDFDKFTLMRWIDRCFACTSRQRTELLGGVAHQELHCGNRGNNPVRGLVNSMRAIRVVASIDNRPSESLALTAT
jgi:hypothetical protein